MLFPKLTRSRPVQGWIDADESRDAYENEDPPSEPVRCSICDNVYVNKQWYTPDESPLEEIEQIDTHTCPGCQKLRDGYYYGELTIEGDFLKDHSEELSNLIQNEVQRVQTKNPLSKLVSADSDGGEVVLRTTNAKLAEHIGRSLHKAYEGTIDIDKSEYITRVHWTRNKTTSGSSP